MDSERMLFLMPLSNTIAQLKIMSYQNLLELIVLSQDIQIISVWQIFKSFTRYIK